MENIMGENKLDIKNLFQECVSEYYNNKNFFVYDDYAVIDYGDFELFISYVQNENIDVIDYKLKFSNSEIYFNFYEIFNVFDIDDFDLYTFFGDFDKEALYEIIKKADDTVTKYYSKLKIVADEPNLLHELENDVIDCFNAEYGYFDDNDKEDLEYKEELYNDAISLYGFSEEIQGYATVYERKNLHKRLKACNKNNLLNLYEKRLLKFLDNGGELPNTKIRNDSLFSGYLLKGISVVSMIVCAIIIILYFVINKIIYNGAEVYFEENHIRDSILFGVISIFFICTFVFLLLGKSVLSLFTPKEDRNWFKRKFLWEFNLVNKSKWNKVASIIAIIFCILIGLLFYSFLFDNVGYYDDYVRFGVTNSFTIVDIQYEDLKIYKVLNSDVTCGHKKYGNVYAISDENGKNYYEFGEIDPNGKTQKKLNEIAEQYNIEIIVIESINDLS